MKPCCLVVVEPVVGLVLEEVLVSRCGVVPVAEGVVEDEGISGVVCPVGGAPHIQTPHSAVVIDTAGEVDFGAGPSDEAFDAPLVADIVVVGAALDAGPEVVFGAEVEAVPVVVVLVNRCGFVLFAEVVEEGATVVVTDAAFVVVEDFVVIEESLNGRRPLSLVVVGVEEEEVVVFLTSLYGSTPVSLDGDGVVSSALLTLLPTVVEPTQGEHGSREIEQ